MGYQSRIAEDEYLKQERLLQILLKSQELESLKEKYKIEVLQKVTSLEDAKKKVEKKLKEQQALYENVLADRKVLETAVAHSESSREAMLAKLGEEQKEAIQVMKKRTESDRQDLFAANSRIEHLEKNVKIERDTLRTTNAQLAHDIELLKKEIENQAKQLEMVIRERDKLQEIKKLKAKEMIPIPRSRLRNEVIDSDDEKYYMFNIVI